MKRIFSLRYTFLFVMAWTLVLLTSCYPGQKLAKTYVEEGVDLDFIVLAPEFIYKENLKTYILDTMEDLTGEQQDSVLFYESRYLKEIDDSIYIHRFTESLISHMNELNLTTYGEDKLDSLLSSGNGGYILNIAQLLMEEYVTPYEPQAVLYDEVVSAGAVDLNAVNVSNWFELSRMNPEEEDPFLKVLFASDEITDKVEGQFVQYLLSGVVYEFTVDTLETKDLYKAATVLGYKYSMYLYDYLLNLHILREDPTLAREQLYYHYDPDRDKVYPIAEGFRFIEIEQ